MQHELERSTDSKGKLEQQCATRNSTQFALKYLKSCIQSGTFIACMNALEKVKAEQAIDIFQIVRYLKLVRPRFMEIMVSF